MHIMSFGRDFAKGNMTLGMLAHLHSFHICNIKPLKLNFHIGKGGSINRTIIIGPCLLKATPKSKS